MDLLFLSEKCGKCIFHLKSLVDGGWIPGNPFQILTIHMLTWQKPRNDIQKSFQMIQSNFYHKSDPDFFTIFPRFRIPFIGNPLCPKVSHRPICHIVAYLSSFSHWKYYENQLKIEWFIGVLLSLPPGSHARGSVRVDGRQSQWEMTNAKPLNRSSPNLKHVIMSRTSTIKKN